jgi:hypothetical protein
VPCEKQYIKEREDFERVQWWLIGKYKHTLKDHSPFIFRVKQSIKSITIYQLTWSNISADFNLQKHHCESLKPCTELCITKRKKTNYK